MTTVTEHLNLLGKKVEDRITGFKGVVTSVSFDLNGSMSGLVTPPFSGGPVLQERYWFDVARLAVSDHQPVIDQPFYYGADEREKDHEKKTRTHT